MQLMKFILTLCAWLLLSSPAWALDLVWDRNAEADMSHYGMWWCADVGTLGGDPLACTKANATNFDTAPQPAVGVAPTYTYTGPSAGNVFFVTAVDTSGNESGESNRVLIATGDTTAPGTPANLSCQSIEAGLSCH